MNKSPKHLNLLFIGINQDLDDTYINQKKIKLIKFTTHSWEQVNNLDLRNIGPNEFNKTYYGYPIVIDETIVDVEIETY